IPVITGTEEPEALGVIRAIAGQNGARLVEVSPDDASRPPLDTLELPLLGEHQRMNAAVTAAVVRALATQLPVSDEVLRAGLATTRWAGRLQTIQRANQTLLLDGAHNVAGAKVLRAAFTKHFGNRRMALVLGALQDKQWAEICGILAPLANQILLAPVASERTTSPAQLAAVCQAANPAADVIICQSLAEALQFVASVPLVVVTGSLYLVGEALELLGGGGGPSERALNEWQPRPVQ
ncbi:MAG TPA: cyanophycin synthetase, partial [Verrucomicrobiae bacterium]|nr:cyanophycin synthetase [Verrucomicrobiae bacterium]